MEVSGVLSSCETFLLYPLDLAALGYVEYQRDSSDLLGVRHDMIHVELQAPAVEAHVHRVRALNALADLGRRADLSEWLADRLGAAHR